MVEGRHTADLDAVLERTSVGSAASPSETINRVPWNAIEVADALVAHRAALEAGGVFPEVLIDKLVAKLRG
jgi:hypothetical protein